LSKLHLIQSKTKIIYIITLSIYEGLQILERAISTMNATIQMMVSTKNTSSPYLSTDSIRMSSPNKAYMVTSAIIIENGKLSVMYKIFLIRSD
jgi:hypothetical protein